MIPRRVWLAVLLAFTLHGFLILTGQYTHSFDAYTHEFFGDHYRTNWWGLWDVRWYTGFSIVSYPPLVHQLIGLLSHIVGLDIAFAAILWVTLTAYPLAVYAFSRSFFGRNISCYAALGAAFAPSVYLAAHVFGQIPTMVATLFALFGIATLADFLRHGKMLTGALAIALLTVVMAAHHATLMFLPWVVIGLVIHILLNEKVNKKLLWMRLIIFTALAIFFGLAVIWPFWLWGQGQQIQTPIDHPTRHNYLTDSFALTSFFLPAYGPLLIIIPFALCQIFQRRYIGLSIAFIPLFILGLGGTTPLPQLLFGKGWEWLIYDRFAFWASLLLLPFLGIFILIIAKYQKKFTTRKLHRPAVIYFLIVMGINAGITGLLPTLMPFEPAPINMQPIVNFLAEDNHKPWRYITLGFGDQLAKLSTLTAVTTIDGNYHTARNLPELRNSGIGQIDTAFWMKDGFAALDPILQKSGERGVRWGFVGLKFYIPVLERNGWVKLTTLSNGIEVWENPAAIKPVLSPGPPDDPFQSFSWGVFPLLSLICAVVLSAALFFPQQAQKIISLFIHIWPAVRKTAGHVHVLALGVLPVALCFFYYIPLIHNPLEGIYFTYTDSLLFASDIVALVVIFTWLIADQPTFPHLNQLKRYPLEMGVAGLCLLASLSVIWSVDWRVSLFFSLHLWLVFGLFLAVRAHPENWRAVATGFCVALLLQIVIGSAEFLTQTTTFLAPLGLEWPGQLNPSMRGAGIVELPDGTRWLRAYGTLPHPNVLGGFTLVFLGGPVGFFLLNEKRRPWAWILLAGGASLLVLTFSRAAWVGLGVAGLVLALRVRQLPLKRLAATGLAALTGLLIAAAPLWHLIFVRAGGNTVAAETYSNTGRIWLMEQAIKMIRNHPLVGVGAGAFLVEYMRYMIYGYLVEPVHNLPLLVTTELGLAGAVIGVGLGVVVLRRVWLAASPTAILFSALLLGLLTTSLFDHYLWTLAPGRMLLGIVLGLWAAQIKQEHENVTHLL